MPLDELQLRSASNEAGCQTGIERSGRRDRQGAAPRSFLECPPGLVSQSERLAQQAHRVALRHLTDASLDVANASRTHPRALGELLLRQLRGTPMLAQ